MRAVYLVCYDVADPKRLRKVHQATCDRGERLQYSVYQCDLSRLQLARLKADLLEVIERSEDQVLFVHLGPRKAVTYGRIEWIGRSYQPPEHRSIVV